MDISCHVVRRPQAYRQRAAQPARRSAAGWVGVRDSPRRPVAVPSCAALQSTPSTHSRRSLQRLYDRACRRGAACVTSWSPVSNDCATTAHLAHLAHLPTQLSTDSLDSYHLIAPSFRLFEFEQLCGQLCHRGGHVGQKLQQVAGLRRRSFFSVTGRCAPLREQLLQRAQ